MWVCCAFMYISTQPLVVDLWCQSQAGGQTRSSVLLCTVAQLVLLCMYWSGIYHSCVYNTVYLYFGLCMNVFMHVYVCIHAFVYVGMCTCGHIYLCVYICICACMYACIYALICFMYVCIYSMCVCMFAWVNIGDFEFEDCNKSLRVCMAAYGVTMVRLYIYRCCELLDYIHA